MRQEYCAKNKNLRENMGQEYENTYAIRIRVRIHDKI